MLVAHWQIGESIYIRKNPPYIGANRGKRGKKAPRAQPTLECGVIRLRPSRRPPSLLFRNQHVMVSAYEWNNFWGLDKMISSGFDRVLVCLLNNFKISLLIQNKRNREAPGFSYERKYCGDILPRSGWISGKNSSLIIWLDGQGGMQFRFVLFNLANLLRTGLLSASTACTGKTC